MNSKLLGAIALMFAGATSIHAQAAEPAKATTASSSAVLLSGIFTNFSDASVKPQDDFFRHVNGKWLKTHEIPGDKSGAGAFLDLREATIPQLGDIIKSLAKQKNTQPGSEAGKISDMYSTFMDEAHIEALGLKPMEADFAQVAAITDKKQFPAMIAYLNLISGNAPYDITIHQDAKDSSKYIADLGQSGLGMPDRDYYLKDDDARLKDARSKYLVHVEKMLSMAGDKDAAKSAADI